MDKLALDTSAFVKLYLPETGSAWLRNFILGKEVIISQLVLFEFTHTITRLHREGHISRTDADSLYRRAKTDTTRFTNISIRPTRQMDKCYELGVNLPSILRLRTLDGIHLATALLAQTVANSLNPSPSFTFVTADAQLVRTAQHFGLTTENPENHS
jgi:uncharacterized protein